MRGRKIKDTQTELAFPRVPNVSLIYSFGEAHAVAKA